MTCCHHLLGVEEDHGEAMTGRVVPYLASDSDGQMGVLHHESARCDECTSRAE